MTERGLPHMKNSRPLLVLLSVFFLFTVGGEVVGGFSDWVIKRKIANEIERLEALPTADVFEYFYVNPAKLRIAFHEPFRWTAKRDVRLPVEEMLWDEEILCDSELTPGIVWSDPVRFRSSSRKVSMGESGGGVFTSRYFESKNPVLAPGHSAVCQLTSTITAVIEYGVEFTIVVYSGYVYVGDYPALPEDLPQ